MRAHLHAHLAHTLSLHENDLDWAPTSTRPAR